VEYVSLDQSPLSFVRIKNLKITIFWNLTPSSFFGGRGNYSLYHHSRRYVQTGTEGVGRAGRDPMGEVKQNN
jgi:hypothetical protein